MSPYYPRPGTVAYRVLALLEQQRKGGKLSLGAIAGELNTGAASVLSSIEQALAVGLIVRTTPPHQERPGMYHVDREVLEKTRAALRLNRSDEVAPAQPVGERAAPPEPAAQAAPGAIDAETVALIQRSAAPVLVDLHAPAAKQPGLVFALWSDGTLEIVRRTAEGDDLLLALKRDETRQLVDYLDAISLDVVRGTGE